MEATLPSDEEILVTRIVKAPPHLVYKAWTTPASEEGAVINTATFEAADGGPTLVSIGTNAGSN
jgi:hypothetical protein